MSRFNNSMINFLWKIQLRRFEPFKYYSNIQQSKPTKNDSRHPRFDITKVSEPINEAMKKHLDAIQNKNRAMKRKQKLWNGKIDFLVNKLPFMHNMVPSKSHLQSKKNSVSGKLTNLDWPINKLSDISLIVLNSVKSYITKPKQHQMKNNAAFKEITNEEALKNLRSTKSTSRQPTSNVENSNNLIPNKNYFEKMKNSVIEKLVKINHIDTLSKFSLSLYNNVKTVIFKSKRLEMKTTPIKKELTKEKQLKEKSLSQPSFNVVKVLKPLNEKRKQSRSLIEELDKNNIDKKSPIDYRKKANLSMCVKHCCKIRPRNYRKKHLKNITSFEFKPFLIEKIVSKPEKQDANGIKEKTSSVKSLELNSLEKMIEKARSEDGKELRK